MLLEMKVKTVALVQGGSFSVILTDQEEKRVLPIMVGPYEAQAISLPLHGEATPRPLTHDLMKSMCDQMGYSLEKIVVTDIHDGTFYAEVYLQGREQTLTIDARPSDAIALAMRCNAPIYMEARMIEFTYNYEDMVFMEGTGQGEEE